MFKRQHNNILSNWWWTVDRYALIAIVLMIALGGFIVTSASPSVAEKIGLDTYYFVKRQIVFFTLALAIIIGMSFLSQEWIKRIGIIGLVITIILLLAVLLTGAEAKGAKRWVYIGSFSLQPSEFAKPFFIIVSAWILSFSGGILRMQQFKIVSVLYVLLISLFLLQPDVGMTMILSLIWIGQLFIAGIQLQWMGVFFVLMVFILEVAYYFFPHVTFRIDSFIASFDGGGNFQVRKSLEAFEEGGFFGKGPGEGVVKQSLPDSHTDFIFAVAGEELGALVCIGIVLIYAFLVVRGLMKMLHETDLFVVYAVSGLLILFGSQSIINMGVALNLLPTKGMTLPFISYGGSSLLAMACAIGMLLALTKRQYGMLLKRPHVVHRV